MLINIITIYIRIVLSFCILQLYFKWKDITVAVRKYKLLQRREAKPIIIVIFIIATRKSLFLIYLKTYKIDYSE